MAANVDWVAAATAKPDLYLMVPFKKSTGAAVKCYPTPTVKRTSKKTGQINMSATAKIAPGVTALFYTPCTVTMAGTTHVGGGQIYSGSFTGTAGMSFGSPPTPPGLKGTVASAAKSAFTTGIIYERET